MVILLYIFFFSFFFASESLCAFHSHLYAVQIREKVKLWSQEEAGLSHQYVYDNTKAHSSPYGPGEKFNSNHDNNNCIERCNWSPTPALKWPSHNRVKIMCKTKSHATHQSLITCNMWYATWYKGTAQLLSLTEFKSHLFFVFFCLIH